MKNSPARAPRSTRVEEERAGLAPAFEAADTAEAETARLRSEVDARAAVAHELTPEGRELRAAEEAVQAADTGWRSAEAEASRWRARAEMLAARARRSPRRGRR